MPITGLAIAAGIGLLKSEAIDKPQAERKRKLAAETQRLSPWTGNKAEAVQEADSFGTALQYGAAGASMGAGYDQSQTDKALAARLNSGGSVTGYGKNMYTQQPSYLGGNDYSRRLSSWD